MKKRLRNSLAWLVSCTTLICSLPTQMLYAAPEAAETVATEETASTAMDEQDAIAADPPFSIVEISESRDISVKHFLQENGLFSAVSYDVPVHFMDDAGQWQEIDNRLSLSEDGSVYTSSNGPVTKTFAADLKDGFLFRETYKDHSVSISIDNSAATGQKEYSPVTADILKPHDETGMSAFDAAVTPDHLSQTVLYSQVYENVDFSYESYSNSIKENIIIAKPQDNYAYSFLVDAGDMICKQDEEGNIRFSHPQEKKSSVSGLHTCLMQPAVPRMRYPTCWKNSQRKKSGQKQRIQQKQRK